MCFFMFFQNFIYHPEMPVQCILPRCIIFVPQRFRNLPMTEIQCFFRLFCSQISARIFRMKVSITPEHASSVWVLRSKTACGASRHR